jgi:hypothetical protein
VTQTDSSSLKVSVSRPVFSFSNSISFLFRPLGIFLFLVPAFMSSYNDPQPYPIVKSESPPPRSISISSTAQSQSPSLSSDTAPSFRFGSRAYSHLPPFSFMPQRSSPSSTWPHHTAYASDNPYASSPSTSQSHFVLSSMDDPTVLALTDEYDDGDELLGDLPSGSNSAIDMFHESSGSSSKPFDKAVRRRSSKGTLRFDQSLNRLMISIHRCSLRPVS